MFQHFCKDSKGFTLIELMIVIAIIAILSAIAIPQFTKYRKRAAKAHVQGDVRVMLNTGAEMLAGYDQNVYRNINEIIASLSVSANNLSIRDSKYVAVLQASISDLGDDQYEVTAWAIGKGLALNYTCTGWTKDNKVYCWGQ